MQTLMDVVPRVEIAAQHALKLLPDQVLDHFSPPRMMVFVIPDRRSGDAPHVYGEAVFSPTRFICLHRWAGADLGLEATEHRLRIFADPMQQFHQFPETDLKAVQIPQHVWKLAEG